MTGGPATVAPATAAPVVADAIAPGAHGRAAPPAHVLMAAVGSAGDVHPLIAIGQALAQRGHAVELMAAAPFAERIAAAGLVHVPVGAVDDYQRIVAEPDLWHPVRGFALIVRALEAGLAEATRVAAARVRPGTVLVGGTLAWHLRLLQELHRLPAATVHLSPSCIVSARAPPRWPGLALLGALPPWLVAPLQRLAEAAAIDPLIAPGLDRVRATFGLVPVRQVMSRWQHAPQLVVAAWPDWFGPAQSDWPAQACTTGFALWRPALATGSAGAAPTDPALARFLADGPPPVGVTPGSAMAHGRDFFARALAACEALGQRAVLITPYAEQLPPSIGPQHLHLPQVPFEQLLPRLAALVHHGGIGTSAQALAAGVPQLVCPFAHDQFDNAARLRRLGVGRVVGRSAGVHRWQAALAAVLHHAAVRRAAAQWAARMAGAADGGDASEAIAARIEQQLIRREVGAAAAAPA